MKIGIDGYEANTEKRVGIGQYAFQLLQALYSLDTDNEYTIFTPNVPLSDLPQERKGWKYIAGKPGPFWTIWQLPGLIKNEKMQLFFSPTHYIPWFTALPRLAAFMDLSYLRYPEMFRPKDLLQLKYMGLFAMKRARKIFTISEFSKKEIVRYYKYPEADIVVTYPGISSNLKSPFGSAQGRQISNPNTKMKELVKNKFILFVGTIQPRKNIIRLIAAFEMLNKEIQLILVGKKGWLYGPILDRIKSSPKKNMIKFMDYVSAAELTRLYEQTTCLVLPSLYEGFGLPVLEAMNYGCPVVVSNSSSLPEVAGDAGIYVDPLNSDDIARGMTEALQLNPNERRNLVNKGKAQAKKFSWEKCAQKTIETFNAL